MPEPEGRYGSVAELVDALHAAAATGGRMATTDEVAVERPTRRAGRGAHVTMASALDRRDKPLQGSPLVRRSRRRRLLRSHSTRRPARVQDSGVPVRRDRGPIWEREIERRACRAASGLAARSAPRIERMVRDGDDPGSPPVRRARIGAVTRRHHPPASLLEQLRDGARGMARAVRRSLPSDATELVLVIDQFEELFTQVDGAERDQFLAALASAVGDDEARLRVVATIRADYFDRPLTHRSIGELMAAHNVAITPLSAEEAPARCRRPGRTSRSSPGTWTARRDRRGRLGPTGGAPIAAVLPDRAVRAPRRTRDDPRRLPRARRSVRRARSSRRGGVSVPR